MNRFFLGQLSPEVNNCPIWVIIVFSCLILCGNSTNYSLKTLKELSRGCEQCDWKVIWGRITRSLVCRVL